MRVALDTNRYRDLVEGVPEARSVLERADAVLVPFVVVAELRAGFVAGARVAHNERVLADFLGLPGVSVAYADSVTLREFAQLFAFLRRRGTPIPTNDLWIAALALQWDASLFTRDRHFASIPHLPRIEP